MTPVNINGRRYTVDLPDDTPLLWALRDELGLTGTKFGCGMALCGACTVHVDGQPGRACMTPISARGEQEGRHHRGDRRATRSARRCRRRGSSWACRNAATARPGRSCRRRRCSSAPRADRRRDRRGHERQHLPLRHLRAHPRRHQAGGGPARSARDERAAAGRRDRRAGGARQREPAAVPPGRHRRSAGSCSRSASRRPLRAADPPKYGADGMPNGWVDDPLVFVAIGEDGTVSIVCHRSEMGQGVRTGMPMIVADELEADWKRVRVVQATGDEKRFGNQDTDGSRSTRHFFEPMRRCGAAARTMLEAAAAARWKVPVSEVEAKNHEVVHRPTGRRSATARSPRRRPAMPVPARDTMRLKDPSKFRYIGKGKLKLVDGRDIVTGKAQYGIDTRLPGMLYAVVARPPVYGGKVASFDAAAALKVPGVVRVVEIEASPPPAQFNPARRRRGHRAQHLGGDPGPQGAEDRVGRRPERELRLDGLQGDARGGGAQARQGRAQRRRLRRGWRPRRAEVGRRVLHPASRARADGAAGGDRAHRQRQVRGLGLLPVAPGRARPGRQAARHVGRRRHRARHAARRRVRAQVQARLRHRGGRRCPRRWTASRSR